MNPVLRSCILFRLLLATLFLFAAESSSIAQVSTGCVIAQGDLASGASISFTAPPGHTYTFTYTGAASGTISITGTLNIVNGTSGVLHYVVTSDEPCVSTPALSGPTLLLLALGFGGLGLFVLRRKRLRVGCG